MQLMLSMMKGIAQEHGCPYSDTSNPAYPYEVSIRKWIKTYTKLLLWCYDTFDINDWLYLENGSIAFKHEKDLTMFLVYWTGKNYE